MPTVNSKPYKVRYVDPYTRKKRTISYEYGESAYSTARAISKVHSVHVVVEYQGKVIGLYAFGGEI